MNQGVVMNTTRRSLALAAFCGLILPFAAARADLDVTVANGDKVTGTLSPGTESETFRVTLPKDALLSVTAKGVKGGAAIPTVTFAVFDPDGAAVGAALTKPSGKGAKLKKFAATKTGVHRVVVTGNAEGDYALQITWASRKTFGVSGVLAGTAQVFPFAVDSGATATFSVKASKSAALPRLSGLRDGADATIHTFTPPASASASSHTAKSVALTQSGNLKLLVTDAGTGGAFKGSISVKQPKASKRRVGVTSADLPSQSAFATVGIFGPEGLSITVSEPPTIAGAAVSIPAGAMPLYALVVIGTSTTIDPASATLASAGPAVFFGPDGTTFLNALTAQVTIPYDPASVPGDPLLLRVFTRDALGNVTEVTPVTVNSVNHTMTFATAHFSSFQAFRPAGGGQTAKLTIPDPAFGDRLGFSGEISGPRAVLGAPFEELAGGPADAGVAHVFVDGPGGFAHEVALTASDVAGYERFAESSAISGDTVVVGALEHDHGITDSGAAYVFFRGPSVWSQLQELRASDPVNSGQFGWSVAIDGNTIAVGCPQAKNGQNQTVGAVYVFTRTGSTFTEQQKIIPASAQQFAGVGRTVAVKGDTLVFGRSTFASGGAVWVYTRAGGVWTLEQQLQADAPTARDEFGESAIALDGQTLLVGVARTSQNPAASPEVDVFTRSGVTWTKEAFLPSGLTSGATGSFARAVAIQGDAAYVGGATLNGGGGNGSGVVFRFQRTGTSWGPATSIVPVESTANQGFGQVVSVSGSRLLVGAVGDAGFTGAGYVFDAQ